MFFPFESIEVDLKSDEYPGHVESVDLNRSFVPEEEEEVGSKPLEDPETSTIDKSNLLLLGPSGVGKTYSMYQDQLSLRNTSFQSNHPRI